MVQRSGDARERTARRKSYRPAPIPQPATLALTGGRPPSTVFFQYFQVRSADWRLHLTQITVGCTRGFTACVFTQRRHLRDKEGLLCAPALPQSVHAPLLGRFRSLPASCRHRQCGSEQPRPEPLGHILACPGVVSWSWGFQEQLVLDSQLSGFSVLLHTPVSLSLFPFGVTIQLLDFLVMAGFREPVLGK